MLLVILIVAVPLSCQPARAQAPGSPEAQEAAKELPAIMSALGNVGKELEQATANLPDPTYPKQ